MKRVVLEATAFLAWFSPSNPSRTLRAEYEAGLLHVHAPMMFPLHVLEVAAGGEGLSRDRLARLAGEVDRLGFVLQDPPAAELATWLTRGLTGVHAQYVALATYLDIPLVTTDGDLLRQASSVAQEP
jgi:predicted nucleic acid-binding protein